MATVLDDALIETLQCFDTPTVCNALELLIPQRRRLRLYDLSSGLYPPRATTHDRLCPNRDNTRSTSFRLIGQGGASAI